MARISVSNLFFGCVVVSYSLGLTCDRASTSDAMAHTLVPCVPPKPRSALAYTFTYMQWQALPCVPKTMPTPSHSSSLIQTPQAKRPWRQMQAASAPRTATLTAGVSP
ncbi:uncharacterized protein LOC142580198 [Dermacentor variabilis]|uniref:uncharacterized protein LOC142580198 n=1 Tax=Dermacentor variabilis TaxID=34621 RepID=UPI003F5C2D85